MEASTAMLTAAENLGFVFKLFGRTIPLPPPTTASEMPDSGEELPSEESSPVSYKTIDSLSSDEKQRRKHRSSSSSNKEEEKEKTENEEGGSKRPLKKPHKNLPCPRCSSMDTKFCYYNNYNINQPRHFCKNCQRYWTNGGSMRNVPIGSGRRKSKSSSSSISTGHTHYVIPFVHSGSYPVPNQNRGYLSSNSDSPKLETFFLSDFPYFDGFSWPRLSNSIPILVKSPTSYWSSAAVPHTVNFSPVLGKHSREEDTQIKQNRDTEQGDNNNESCGQGTCLWLPKTSTIDVENLKEAATTSIVGDFGTEKKKEMATQTVDTKRLTIEMLNRANPAAWSRSLNFQESS